jgi:hypothetical protein
VDVTAADIAKIPAANLGVPRATFAALWVTAERLHDERAQQRISDWYSAGVVMTCRWLAGATVRPETGPPHPARSPVTGHTNCAYQELIEAEYIEATKLAMCQPRPAWLEQRPGWIEAIEATLHWVQHRYRDPPLEIDWSVAD